MNWDQVKGNWKQLTGKMKEKWGKLTDDDLTVAGGQRDQFLGVLQKRYGYAKEEAEKQLSEFTDSLNK
ncbi:MAG TPA: CsbD family protein [Gemmataceae bacterium]|nr:CsbD family protein [Gemmataceae bacterium]